MKRILCMTLAALLLLSAVLLLPSCAGKGKRTADYVKGDEVVIDNETPFVYSDKTKRVINKNVWGVKREYGLWDFADFCCGTTDTEQETYAFFASYFGAKPIRELVSTVISVFPPQISQIIIFVIPHISFISITFDFNSFRMAVLFTA